jgi:F0F1-type ATP synthase assembly protein I
VALKPRAPQTALGTAFEGALEAGLSVVIGGVAGYYADRWLGTGYWLFALLTIAGAIAGVRRLLQIPWSPTDQRPLSESDENAAASSEARSRATDEGGQHPGSGDAG